MNLIKDRFEHKAGTVVYEFIGHDYGCRRDDEWCTKTPHSVVTLESDGSGAFFTVPTEVLS